MEDRMQQLWVVLNEHGLPLGIFPSREEAEEAEGIFRLDRQAELGSQATYVAPARFYSGELIAA